MLDGFYGCFLTDIYICNGYSGHARYLFVNESRFCRINFHVPTAELLLLGVVEVVFEDVRRDLGFLFEVSNAVSSENAAIVCIVVGISGVSKRYKRGSNCTEFRYICLY